MKRIVFLLAIVLCGGAMAQPVGDRAWRDDVRTIELYAGGGSSAPAGASALGDRYMPVVALNGTPSLVLEFDVLRTEPEHLHWTLRHCTADWQCDDLDPQDFMSGFEQGVIDAFDFSFTTLTDYIHYRATLPDRYAEFRHSGNFVVYVINDDDGDTLLSRRFAVSEQTVQTEASIARPYDGVDIDRRQEVDVCVASSAQLSQQYVKVMVQQNGRLDNQRQLVFSGYDKGSLCYRNRPCNIFAGGNTFRYFDISNIHTPMYNVLKVEEYGGEQIAILRPCEDRSKEHYVAETALRGGMKVNIWDRDNPRIEADYVWVNMTLPMAQPMLDGEVHVAGALTDWKVDSTSRMDYDMRRHAYVKRMLLKQGYYAYQLLVRRVGESEGRTARLEGDNQETKNLYTIYVYYRTPTDRSDRLLGVRMVER